jgi:hypothetical protein
METGALDVCMIPVTLKKGRPGTVFRVLASLSKAEKIEAIIFDQLPTLGIRKQLLERSILYREEFTLRSKTCSLMAKKIYEQDGTVKIVPEFDEKVRLAEEENVPLRKLELEKLKGKK